MKRCLYSKKYPRIPLEQIIADSKKYEQEHPEDEPPDWEEIEEKRHSTLTYVEIPGRTALRNKFISMAEELAEYYEYDTEVWEYDNLIQAEFSFDSQCTSGVLNDIIAMSDDISFFAGIKGRQITMALDYYTRAIAVNGRIMFPHLR